MFPVYVVYCCGLEYDLFAVLGCYLLLCGVDVRRCSLVAVVVCCC